MLLDQYGGPLTNAIPDFGITLTSVKVRSAPRKLQTKVNYASAQDLRADWGSLQPEPSAIDRLAELLYSEYRDIAEIIAKLPEDLIHQDVKDIALGNILRLIPQRHWPSTWNAQPGFWEDSVIGMLSKVIEARALRSK